MHEERIPSLNFLLEIQTTMNFKPRSNVAIRRRMHSHVYFEPPATYTVSSVVWYVEHKDRRAFDTEDGEEGEEEEEEEQDTGESVGL